ncbi:replication factor c subunit [Anaeramoeba flamelloides]|uniref:Replication factor c subunit n=1 Tax=Anaeramoeba flamelloides TaxID=1746091 RepID=A0AAV7ZIR9_9EUKA|nr:replication factor c subunit [Anaeramoeba flamelloides]
MSRSVPWVEKYRPRKVEDVVYQNEVVSALKNSLNSGNLPHLLFYGPPGTGKTSTILAISKQLFGPKLFQTRVKELNASDERGIDVVRDTVKKFASLSSISVDPKYPSPKFKILILDEADSMTSDAQNALRRIMELYSTETRFCLICNYVSKIIDPITSRCAKFRFKPIKKELMFDRLKYIATQERVPIRDKALNSLISMTNGDLRSAITLLQSAAAMVLPLPKQLTTNQISQNKEKEKEKEKDKETGMEIEIEKEDDEDEDEEVTTSLIMEISGFVPAKVINEFIETCKSNSYNNLVKKVKEVIYSAYSIQKILLELMNRIIEENSLNNLQKSNICEKIAEKEHSLIDGADEFLQLLDLAACMTSTFQQIK